MTDQFLFGCGIQTNGKVKGSGLDDWQNCFFFFRQAEEKEKGIGIRMEEASVLQTPAAGVVWVCW